MRNVEMRTDVGTACAPRTRAERLPDLRCWTVGAPARTPVRCSHVETRRLIDAVATSLLGTTTSALWPSASPSQGWPDRAPGVPVAAQTSAARTHALGREV